MCVDLYYLFLDYLLLYKMLKNKMLKSYIIEEDFVFFIKDSFKIIIEKLDLFIKDLWEIKIKMEVSENECNNLEKICSDIFDIKDLM